MAGAIVSMGLLVALAVPHATRWLFEEGSEGNYRANPLRARLGYFQLRFGQANRWNLVRNLLYRENFALSLEVTNYADDYTGSAVKVMNLTSNDGQKFHNAS